MLDYMAHVIRSPSKIKNKKTYDDERLRNKPKLEFFLMVVFISMACKCVLSMYRYHFFALPNKKKTHLSSHEVYEKLLSSKLVARQGFQEKNKKEKIFFYDNHIYIS